MGNIVRDTVKTSAISYAGILIGTINLLWLQAAFLSEAEVGALRYMIDVAALAAPFLMLGTNGVATRYFHLFKDDSGGKQALFTFLMLVPLATIAIFMIGYLFIYGDAIYNFAAGKDELVQTFYPLLIPLIIFQIYIVISESILVANRLLVVPYLLKNVAIRLVMTTLLILYSQQMISFQTFVTTYILSFGVQVLFQTLYIKAKVGFSFKFNLNFKRYPAFNDIVIYSLFLILGHSGTMMVTKIDTIMTEEMLDDMSRVGVYSIAFFIAAIIETPQKVLVQILFPMMSELNTNRDLKKVRDLYRRSAINMFLVGSFIFMLIWFNIDDLYRIIPNGESYADGLYVVFFIGLARVFDMSFGSTSQVLASSKYYRYNFYILPVLGVMTVVTNYYLIPIYGITGTAMATAITIFVYSLTRYFMVMRLLKMNSLSVNHLIILFNIGLVVALFYFVNFDLGYPILSILLKSGIITAMVIGLNYVLKSSEELNETIDKVMRRFFG